MSQDLLQKLVLSRDRMLADKPFLSVDEVDKYSEQSVSSLNYLLLECLPVPKGKNPSGNKYIITDDIPFVDSLQSALRFFWSTTWP